MVSVRRNGWTLLFHAALIDQLTKLAAKTERALKAEPETAAKKPAVKFLAAIEDHIFRIVPEDPAHPRFELGNTLSTENRGWRRAKFYRRYRLFFRFHSQSRLIVFVWINDEGSLRSAGSRRDPYTTFQAMLARGNPPSGWSALLEAARDLPEGLTAIFNEDPAPDPNK